MMRLVVFKKRNEFVVTYLMLISIWLVKTATIICFVSIEQRRYMSQMTASIPSALASALPDHSVSSSSSTTRNTALYDVATSVTSIEQASQILSDFDEMYNPESPAAILENPQRRSDNSSTTDQNSPLVQSIRLLSSIAANERDRDSTLGRCILGICAASAEEGIATLKAWVTGLDLPRGLLHGMDKDGIPLDINGAVYIKYNTGGVYTFSDIRKSGLGK